MIMKKKDNFDFFKYFCAKISEKRLKNIFSILLFSPPAKAENFCVIKNNDDFLYLDIASWKKIESEIQLNKFSLNFTNNIPTFFCGDEENKWENWGFMLCSNRLHSIIIKKKLVQFYSTLWCDINHSLNLDT